jgi:uncharacterized membrane protein
MLARTMRRAAARSLAFVVLLTTAFAAPSLHPAEPAKADDARIPQGLWLTTDFPAMAARPGETTTVKMKLQNGGLPPQRVALSVSGEPKGWKATVLGNGVPVAAAMPATNESVQLQLRVEVPANAQKGTTHLVVSAKGGGQSAELPLDILVGQSLPARLSLKAKLPSQRGSAKSSFEFPVTLQNDSDRDELVKLSAQAPQGFVVTFTEGYGSQEINSIPVEQGQSKDLKVKVQPLESTSAGEYPVSVTAAAEGAQANVKLSMQLTGAPKLSLTTESGRLSGEAEAGKPSPISMVLQNTGSAPATGVTLTSSPPADWKVEMQPPAIPELAPGQKLAVQALITPSAKALTGDYMTTLRASAGGESASADFRITVTTSTLWGIVGVVVIAVALLLAVGAVARFGRR